MKTLTDKERLVALETKMDALLESQKQQSQDFKELNAKLDLLLPTYATQTDLEGLRKAHTLQVWLVGTLSAAFGVIMTILIQNYFTK